MIQKSDTKQIYILIKNNIYNGGKQTPTSDHLLIQPLLLSNLMQNINNSLYVCLSACPSIGGGY